MRLGERTYRCDSCGYGPVDRDLNAAVNLAAWAEAEHRSRTHAPDPQAGGRVTNACGGNGSGRGSRHGETGPREAGTRSRRTGRPRRVLSNRTELFDRL